MEWYTNVTEIYSRLENGSYKVEAYGRMDCYCFKANFFFVPKGSQKHLPPKAGLEYMQLIRESFLNFGLRFVTLCNPYWTTLDHVGPAYYKLNPNSNPSIRVTSDSSTFDGCGKFKPLVKYYGSKRESKFSLFEKDLFFTSSSHSKAYQTWLHTKDVDMQVLTRTDLYDLRPSQYLKSKCGKTWAMERTMTRKKIQDLEILLGKTKVQYKGVRWRPERKNPWVVEINLSKKKKKLWVGNFATQAEAVQAYNDVVGQQSEEKNMNVDLDSSKHVPKPLMELNITTKHVDKTRSYYMFANDLPPPSTIGWPREDVVSVLDPTYMVDLPPLKDDFVVVSKIEKVGGVMQLTQEDDSTLLYNKWVNLVGHPNIDVLDLENLEK